LALTIYRTVQEGLTNALKHAPAAPVRVRVGLLPAQVRVDVENVLPGREPGSGPGTGHGLIGVRERVALFDGTCSAGPSGDGWALSVTLPRAGASEVHATVSGA
jgi:signal transduction histidine kinase